MGLILTATGGLIIWIVLWAIGVASGFDAILIGIGMFLALRQSCDGFDSGW